MPDGDDPRALATPPCRTALAIMAAEERRYDTLPPHLWRRPASLADLEQRIAAIKAQLAAIAARLAAGADLAYWRDCHTRAERQLAIVREAHSTLITDAPARNAPAYEPHLQAERTVR